MPTLHSPSVKNKQEDCAIMLNLDKPSEAGNHRNFDKDLPTLSQKQSKSSISHSLQKTNNFNSQTRKRNSNEVGSAQ